MDTMQEHGISLAKTELVPLGAVPIIWPAVANIFREHPRGWNEITTLESIQNVVSIGAMHLWMTVHDKQIKLVALAYPEQHALRSSYCIVWCGGQEFKTYGLKSLHAIETFALRYGFYDVTLVGRPGWTRLLRPAGYSSRLVHLSKVVQVHQAGKA